MNPTETIQPQVPSPTPTRKKRFYHGTKNQIFIMLVSLVCMVLFFNLSGATSSSSNQQPTAAQGLYGFIGLIALVIFLITFVVLIIKFFRANSYDNRLKRWQKETLKSQKRLEQEAASGQTYTRAQIIKQNSPWRGIINFLLISAILIFAGIATSQTHRGWLAVETVLGTAISFFLFWTRRKHKVDPADLARQTQRRRVMGPQYLALIFLGGMTGIILGALKIYPPSAFFILFGSFLAGMALMAAWDKISA